MSSLPRATAALLRAIVESSDDAIISKDLDGVVTSWNRAAELMFGYSAQEMIGRSIRAIIPADRQSEEDRVLASIRRGERVDHFETIRETKSGELIPISLTVSPVYTHDGRLVGASKVARDIRERRRAEATAEAEKRRETVLVQVTAALSQSLDYERTLRTIAETSIPHMADWCAVDVLGDDGTVRRVARAHVDPARIPVMDRVHEEYADPDLPTGPDAVIKSGRPVVMETIADDLLVSAAEGDPARLAFLRSIGFSSYMCVPMLARGCCTGAITFTSTVSGRRYGQADVRLAQEVAMRAALAVENARAYEQVQSANRLKDEFLATLSHEMRTPLNAVLGYARMLRSGVIGAERHEQALDVIERNASALTQIVEDVLDVSRIISGKARLELRPVMLQGVIEDAIATVLPAAEAKGVKLGAFLEPEIGPVAGDPDRLRQVVWNILSNAVKFTSRGQRVQVRLEASPMQVDIVVTDTGIGISPEFLPHIFERFRQAEGGTTRQHGGLGLGLAIARHIVEMHGGTIQAASDGAGMGSTFRVQLPAAAGARPARVPVVGGEVQAGAVPSAVATALEGVTVLAVDDDLDARDLLESILEGAGASVTTAASVAEAMDRLTTLRPSVLVADLGMPGEDGFGLIARVRQLTDETLRAIPAAAVTAYARPEDRARALKSGFSLHLAKPIDPFEVVTAVAVLARRPTPTA